MKYDPNDWRLTAYVLGELDDEDRAAVEAMLAGSEEARRAVDEIRRATGLLEDELRKEPVAGLTQDQRKAIEDQAAQINGRRTGGSTSLRSWLRRPLVRVALAASVLIVCGVYFLMPKIYRARSFGPNTPVSIFDSVSQEVPSANPTKETKSVRRDSTKREKAREAWRQQVETMRTQKQVASRPLSMEGGERAKRKGDHDRGVRQALMRQQQLLRESSSTNKQTPQTNTDSESYTRWVPVASKSNDPLLPEGACDVLPEVTRHEGEAAVVDEYGIEVLRPVDAKKFASLGYVAPNALAEPGTGALSGIVVQPSDDEMQRQRQLRMYRQRDFNTEAYDQVIHNPFREVTQNPLSTFSIDVDTASYSNLRRFLRQGMMPPAGAVRIEEMINYFTYDYPQPRGDAPFSVNVEMGECPWSPSHRLARIGLKGREVEADRRPAGNLVFLLDVSGSMQPENKLPLVRRAMRMLVERLTPEDRVAIAVYAGASGLVLPSTSCDERETILDALDRLKAGGSTNGGQGIKLAYDVAVDNFIPGGINRVILATDGDFNVGVTNQGELIRLIEEKAASGVFLSVLGFGMGNYKDSTLEKLADKGNGNYAYIDTLSEARKVLVEQLSGTLVTIAKDVKIQIEFNPAEVAAYRLIGYENRILAAEDFNDDTKDAGEIGAGHTVTALYEIVPVGVPVDHRSVDPLKYQSAPAETPRAYAGETMTVKLRYKEPDGHTSRLLEHAITDPGLALVDASDDFIFAAAVASFGMILRDSPNKGGSTLGAVLELAQQSIGEDPHGYRAEFVDMVRRAIGVESTREPDYETGYAYPKR